LSICEYFNLHNGRGQKNTKSGKKRTADKRGFAQIWL
jgi:hypothetical protein